MKKLMIIIALAVMCLPFAGCDSESSGSFYKLSELYDSGVVTRDDIMNVAILRLYKLEVVIDDTKDRSEWEFEELSFHTGIRLEDSLTKESERKIERDFKATKEGLFSHYELTYYGTYGGYVVAEIRYGIVGQAVTDEAWDMVIAGVLLGEFTRYTEFIVWKENPKE